MYASKVLQQICHMQKLENQSPVHFLHMRNFKQHQPNSISMHARPQENESLLLHMYFSLVAVVDY